MKYSTKLIILGANVFAIFLGVCVLVFKVSDYFADRVEAGIQAEYRERGAIAERAGVPANANPCEYHRAREAWLDGWIESHTKQGITE